jgi:hypothetical protein
LGRDFVSEEAANRFGQVVEVDLLGRELPDYRWTDRLTSWPRYGKLPLWSPVRRWSAWAVSHGRVRFDTHTEVRLAAVS